jgi:aryl-alcohol dehydrogenase-like predicted oxidoreductase
MQYRRLGKTNLRVSIVGIGTWQFGGEWGKQFTHAEADRLLGRAHELGINLLDTAECYGDHLSERLVGQAIRSRRAEWVVATKFGHQFDGPFRRSDRWSAAGVQAQLEASLRALGVEKIDLYQFHSGNDQVFEQDDLWAMLDRQVRAGKVHHLGISISSKSENLSQVQQASRVGAGAIQLVYNRLDRTPEARVLPACREQDLGVLARVPLASGLLTGKYSPGAQFDRPDDIRSLQSNADVQQRLQAVQEIMQQEVPAGVPPAAWALAWCLQHPAVTCVIPGCKTVEQVELNASAADLVRTDHPQAQV